MKREQLRQTFRWFALRDI